MNLFKSIQHMVLASLVMTVAMPTVTVAMARNQRTAQRRGPIERREQARKSNKPVKKLSLWDRIKVKWEYAALGGCALVAIAVLLWNLNQKGSGTKLHQKQKPDSRPAAVWIDEKVRGECPICVLDNVALGHPSCCPNQICRACWDAPVKTGDTEFVDDAAGIRIVDQGKVRNEQSCPFCRAGK